MKKRTVIAAFGAAALTGLIAGTASASVNMMSDGVTLQKSRVTFVNGFVAADAGAPAAGHKDAASGKHDCNGKHDCKGKNDCKGKGNCKTGDAGCKGKNSCKGKGGCASPKEETHDHAAEHK